MTAFPMVGIAWHASNMVLEAQDTQNGSSNDNDNISTVTNSTQNVAGDEAVGNELVTST